MNSLFENMTSPDSAFPAAGRSPRPSSATYSDLCSAPPSPFPPRISDAQSWASSNNGDVVYSFDMLSLQRYFPPDSSSQANRSSSGDTIDNISLSSAFQPAVIGYGQNQIFTADLVKRILAKPIQLAHEVDKAADEAFSFKQECSELKAKTEKLAGLLWRVARASNDLYERPIRRIIDNTEQVLDKALSLVQKCRGNALMKRLFTVLPAAAFPKMLAQLENSIGDVSWLLRVSAPAEDCGDVEYLGLPPIATNEPILCFIWEQIAILYTGSPDDRSDAAASLVSLAREAERNGKLIVQEGGVGPLLKLLKEGKREGQENAGRAIGLLGRDPECVQHMVQAGACSVFGKILKEGPMNVQPAVWELVTNYPEQLVAGIVYYFLSDY